MASLYTSSFLLHGQSLYFSSSVFASSSGLHLHTVEMSVNSSTSSNSSLGSLFYCIDSKASISVSAFFVIRSFLLPPLSILVLYLGHQRWRQKRSVATMSHSYIFTYHLAAIELLGSLGSPFYFCGLVTKLPGMIEVGLCLYSFTCSRETLFHILTCVECYLAVVHPIISG